MATPHASGVASILYAYKEDLSFDEAKDALFSGAERDVGSTGKTCDGQPDTVFPNNIFGSGRVDALKSLEYLVQRNKASY